MKKGYYKVLKVGKGSAWHIPQGFKLEGKIIKAFELERAIKGYNHKDWYAGRFNLLNEEKGHVALPFDFCCCFKLKRLTKREVIPYLL